MPRLSKKRFFKWARARQTGPVFSELGITAGSPIARYARSEGFRNPHCGIDFLSHGRSEQVVSLPGWARCVEIVALSAHLILSGTIADLLRELRKRGIRP